MGERPGEEVGGPSGREDGPDRPRDADPSPGRPSTLKERLAAARSGGTTPAPAPAPVSVESVAPEAPAGREPPIGAADDPRALAEALRRAAAKRDGGRAVAEGIADEPTPAIAPEPVAEPIAARRRLDGSPAWSGLFDYFHPVGARGRRIGASSTWFLVVASFYLFLVEAATGVPLMFSYRPTPEHAYDDVLSLPDVATPGVLRELHRWGGDALVIAAVLHMYRVFLTGRYKPPRRSNWSVGVLLLALTLLMGYTGHRLPWDGMASRGVGAIALNRSYVLHCAAIPMAAALLIAVHLRRVREDGEVDAPT